MRGECARFDRDPADRDAPASPGHRSDSTDRARRPSTIRYPLTPQRVTTRPARAARLWDVITDSETWRPTQLRAVRPPVAAPSFIEDEDLSAAATLTPERTVLSPDERLVLAEKLEHEALAKRFKELDRRS